MRNTCGSGALNKGYNTVSLYLGERRVDNHAGVKSQDRHGLRALNKVLYVGYGGSGVRTMIERQIPDAVPVQPAFCVDRIEIGAGSIRESCADIGKRAGHVLI